MDQVPMSELKPLTRDERLWFAIDNAIDLLARLRRECTSSRWDEFTECIDDLEAMRPDGAPPTITPELDAQLKLILRNVVDENEFDIHLLATAIEHLLLPSAAPPPHKPVPIPADVEREDDTQELLEQEERARTEQEKAAWRKEPRV